MNILSLICTILGTIVSVYTIACFIRIFITWMPKAAYSKPGLFLARFCDPYLNMFKRFSSFRTSRLDFTPVLALGVLYIVSNIFINIAALGIIHIGIILAVTLRVIWSFFSSFVTIIVILLFIRFIFSLIQKGSTSQFWQTVDSFCTPIVFKVSGLFTGKRTISYTTALGITVATFFIATIFLNWFVAFIAMLLSNMPF